MNQPPINDFEQHVRVCADRMFEHEHSGNQPLVTFLKTVNTEHKPNFLKRMLTTITPQVKK